MRAAAIACVFAVWALGPTAALAQQLFVDATTQLPGGGLEGRSMHALAVDIDADGDLDIVVAREFQTNAILVNNGRGVFTDESRERLPEATRDSEEVVAVDFDDDGAVDLMFVSEDDAVHEFYLNDGNGFFLDASDRIPVTSVANAAVVMDVNGDDRPDVVLGNNGQNIVLVNDGAGGFVDETIGRLPMVDDVTQDIEIGDVDGDGDVDMVVANEGVNFVLINDGVGRFADAAGLPTVRTETRMANLGDVNGDGTPDLFFSNVSVFMPGVDPQNRLYLNNGAGLFDDVTDDRLPPDSGQSFESKLLDVNADGAPDLIIGDTNNLGGPGTAPLRVWVNDGEGVFEDRSSDALPAQARGNVFSIAAGDFNGDGVEDFYLALRHGRDILLLAE